MSNILDQKAVFQNAGYTYGYGGNGSDGTIDCSQLVNQMLRSSGYDIPYQNTAALKNSSYFEEVDPAEVRPGDILLWRGNNNHVGIVEKYDPVTGNGNFFGSQSSTGPATAPFGTGYWKAPTVFLRPSSQYYKGDICLPKYSQPNPLQKLYSGNVRPSPACNTNFLAAPKAAPLRRDPLILDLDNDGLETVGIDTARPILFDHTGTGLKTASGWVKPDDAFLVIDRNGNGRIDSGHELFGDATPLAAGGSAADGFAALAQEDSNHDGQVTAADARWADLRLWRDLNQDGLTQSDELSTLSDHGITALNVAKTSHSTLLDNGNQIADLGGFLRADGRLGTLGEVEQLEQLADINLISNPFYSEFTDAIPLTETAQHLPDMQGSGKVRDLRQAASLQTPAGQALAAALDAFAAAPTRSEQMHQLDGLLKAWAETSTMATTASGAFAGVDLSLTFAGVAPDSPAWQAWMDKLSIIERFNGQTFLPVPAAGTTLAIDFYSTREALLDAAYSALKDSVYGALVLQTRLKPYLDAVVLTIDERGISLDFSGVEAANDFEWREAA